MLSSRTRLTKTTTAPESNAERHKPIADRRSPKADRRRPIADRRDPSRPVWLDLPDRLGDRLPLPLLLDLRELVLALGQILGLLLELEVALEPRRRQPAVGGGLANGARRL